MVASLSATADLRSDKIQINIEAQLEHHHPLHFFLWSVHRLTQVEASDASHLVYEVLWLCSKVSNRACNKDQSLLSTHSLHLAIMAPHPHLGWINPVINHDFADPGVFYDPVSNKWYAYGTNSNGKNIQCSYTTDFCSWTHHDQDVLPGPFPPWTGQPGFFWAPEVIPAPQGRPGYLMYTSCQDKSTGKQCIGVAYTQGGPLGPFSFISYGPIVSRGETGGTLSVDSGRETILPS